LHVTEHYGTALLGSTELFAEHNQRKAAVRIESLAGFGERLGVVEAQLAGVPQDEELSWFSGYFNKLP
jgi:hypothetical protein